jgi:hypothetical protein
MDLGRASKISSIKDLRCVQRGHHKKRFAIIHNFILILMQYLSLSLQTNQSGEDKEGLIKERPLG